MPSDLGRTLIIANPTAQRGNGRHAASVAFDLMSEWMGTEAVTLAFTERPSHATQLASEAHASSYDTIIALGGDGVVHEVVNGLMKLAPQDRPRFGLIPVGSGNDYARTLGMSECVPDAVVQFLEATEATFDVGKCNDEFFAETLSFGLDAAIALDTVQRRMRTGEQGTILYLKSGIDQLLHHLDNYGFRAVLDGGREGQITQDSEYGMPCEGQPSPRSAQDAKAGQRIVRKAGPEQRGAQDAGPEQRGVRNAGPGPRVAQDAGPGQRVVQGRMHMLTVQVGPTYGGGFRICPNASATDGAFDICYAEAPMCVLEATVKFLSAKNAHHLRWKNIHFERAESLSLAFEGRPPCQIDGEAYQANSYEITTIPRALRVLVGH